MPLGRRATKIINANFIVAKYFDLMSKIAEILHEVPGETVVIVDERQHRLYVAGLPRLARRL